MNKMSGLSAAWITGMLAVFMLCLLTTGTFAAIGGPTVITPGKNTSFTFSGGNSPIWSTSLSNNLRTLTTNNAGTSATLNISTGALACQMTISVQYLDQSNASHTDTKVVDITPFLASSSGPVPTTVYPGQSFGLQIQDNCVNRTGCLYSWGINDASACSGCGNSLPTNNITVSCPVSLTPIMNNAGKFTINSSQNCQNPSASSFNMAQLDVQIKLQNPSIIGPNYIGCSGVTPSNLIFSATNVTGAAYWVWTYPTNLFDPVGGTNGQNLTLTAKEIGSGQVKVQAYSASGSLVFSAVAVSNVQVCCVSHRNITQNVGNGATEQKESGVEINLYNTISSGALAIYHAGNEVRLNPGFEAQLGCNFHAYPEACTGQYNRIAFPGTEPEMIEFEGQLKEQDLELNTVTEQGELGFSVFPNPGDGRFMIRANKSIAGEIFIRNDLGVVFYQRTIDNLSETEIDLRGLAAGIYILNVSTKNTHLKPVKLIIE